MCRFHGRGGRFGGSGGGDGAPRNDKEEHGTLVRRKKNQDHVMAFKRAKSELSRCSTKDSIGLPKKEK